MGQRFYKIKLSETVGVDQWLASLHRTGLLAASWLLSSHYLCLQFCLQPAPTAQSHRTELSSYWSLTRSGGSVVEKESTFVIYKVAVGMYCMIQTTMTITNPTYIDDD